MQCTSYKPLTLWPKSLRVSTGSLYIMPTCSWSPIVDICWLVQKHTISAVVASTNKPYVQKTALGVICISWTWLQESWCQSRFCIVYLCANLVAQSLQTWSAYLRLLPIKWAGFHPVQVQHSSKWPVHFVISGRKQAQAWTHYVPEQWHSCDYWKSLLEDTRKAAILRSNTFQMCLIISVSYVSISIYMLSATWPLLRHLLGSSWTGPCQSLHSTQ